MDQETSNVESVMLTDAVAEIVELSKQIDEFNSRKRVLTSAVVDAIKSVAEFGYGDRVLLGTSVLENDVVYGLKVSKTSMITPTIELRIPRTP